MELHDIRSPKRRATMTICVILPVLATWAFQALAAPCVFSGATSSQAADGQSGAVVTVTIPRVQHPPALEDFLEMKPSAAAEGQLRKVDQFIQERPKDGEPSSQRTEAYLGYDDKNLYVIFLAFDSQPEKLRARMVSRENFVDNTGTGIDDLVSISLDTFLDRRRGYVFQANAYGIQWDALFTDTGGFDVSWDAVWQSRGRVTPQGYVVWMAIPFRSLRFSNDSQQTWGILLNRDIPRSNESVFWPRHTTRIQGFINQAARLEGLENISPGRNIQFIPYGAFRSFRALDTRDPLAPRYVRKRAEGDAGLDAKFVFRDSMVLDVTANPDFSHVESDEPQVTVNQRFELYYPEKRPFFIENAGYFRTPNNLLFTRRIADPRLGARLTGKLGHTAIGALVVDDESPGKSVPPGDPLEGRRALFGVLRISQDVFSQSSLGFIYTDREFQNSHNRVGGVDGRLRFGKNWTTLFQAVTSSTRALNGSRLAGPAYDWAVSRRGRQFNFNLTYIDRSPGFRTQTGFLPRPDIRGFSSQAGYQFRPEGKFLIAWGPMMEANSVWDHAGNHLNALFMGQMSAELIGKTYLSVGFAPEFELFRPQDYPVLKANQGYHRHTTLVSFSTSYLRQISVEGEFRFGLRINVDPIAGQPPELARRDSGNITLTFRPRTSLRIDNTYLLFRLQNRYDDSSIFNNHILRSKWNWQFNRELSLRLILQYDALLANSAQTSLPTTKSFNADFLITYLLRPGTALYLGYNSNLRNVDLLPCGPASSCTRKLVNGEEFRNDAKGLFIKLSYLFRF